ncbi:MAG: hypothetical protein WD768_17450 [Phycisphaeraceae bacterium]
MRLPLLSLFVCLSLLGCESSPVLQPVERASLAHAEELPPGAVFARWKADPNRLVNDIPRAVSRCDWAILNMEPRPQRGKPVPLSVDTPVKAMALLPDDREASILAWKVNDEEVAAAVRVGLLGDRDLEMQFLRALASVMADRPAPRRGGLFELPPLPNIQLVPGKK